MDATRTFESEQGPAAAARAAVSVEEKQAHAYALAQHDRYAAGLGYGTQHSNHYNYLSKAQPPRVPSPFDERPCVFPTVELPERQFPSRPATDLDSLPYHVQDAYHQTVQQRMASHLGRSKAPYYHQYKANTYWRKPGVEDDDATYDTTQVRDETKENEHQRLQAH